MTAKVRTAAGLGYPPDGYTQNANECINSVLKRAAKGKKLSLKETALTIESSVREQENQVKLAMIGIGEQNVAQDYSQFAIPQEKFYSMSTSQRDKALKRFNAAKNIFSRCPSERKCQSRISSKSPQCRRTSSGYTTSRQSK